MNPPPCICDLYFIFPDVISYHFPCWRVSWSSQTSLPNCPDKIPVLVWSSWVFCRPPNFVSSANLISCLTILLSRSLIKMLKMLVSMNLFVRFTGYVSPTWVINVDSLSAKWLIHFMVVHPYHTLIFSLRLSCGTLSKSFAKIKLVHIHNIPLFI